MARLLRSADPASAYAEGSSMQIIEVFTEDGLAAAERDGAYVFLCDEDGGPGRTLYDGTDWLVPRPTYRPADDLEVATPVYVDQRTEVMQSELESLVDVVAVAVADRVPARTIAMLRNRVASARIAMRDGDSLGMAKVAQVLSDTRDAAIFSVERAEEISDARA